MLLLECKRLLIALGYFTRVPIPAWVGWSALELNRAARYFPLVGTGVGLAAAGVVWAGSLVLPVTLAVLLSMTVTLLLTGAFHEDGLADSADGFGGGYTPERVLEIMQDSRIGSFGAVALILALMIKCAALATLAGSTALVACVLVIAHAASRACALALMAALPYARTEGSAKAKPVTEGIGTTEWVTGVLFGMLPLLLATILGWVGAGSAVLAIVFALMTTLLAAGYFRRRIGGYTGDCLGAVQQITELAIYIAFCVRLA